MHGSPVKKRVVERTVSADCRGELDVGRSSESETTSKVAPVILDSVHCVLFCLIYVLFVFITEVSFFCNESILVFTASLLALFVGAKIWALSK